MTDEQKDTQGYGAFLKANEGRSLSKFEYLYMVMRTNAISNDFYLFFSKLFHPTIFVKDGSYFIEENFEEELGEVYVTLCKA